VANATKGGDKDVLSRLADRGEEALSKLAELPGGTKALKAMNELRERVDDLSRRVRGIDKLEERIDRLEKELAGLKRQFKPAASRTAARPKPAGAARKPPPA
jgi:polyhydroxyalkanoate synthesis regulator phasin